MNKENRVRVLAAIEEFFRSSLFDLEDGSYMLPLLEVGTTAVKVPVIISATTMNVLFDALDPTNSGHEGDDLEGWCEMVKYEIDIAFNNAGRRRVMLTV